MGRDGSRDPLFVLGGQWAFSFVALPRHTFLPRQPWACCFTASRRLTFLRGEEKYFATEVAKLKAHWLAGKKSMSPRSGETTNTYEQSKKKRRNAPAAIAAKQQAYGWRGRKGSRDRSGESF